jgi:hypothetical protein
MAVTINKLRIAEGWGKLYADTAPIDGLLSFELFTANYEFFPATQPGRVVPARVLKILYQPPGASGPLQDSPTILNFYGKASQKRYTIWFRRIVNGANVDTLYSMVTLSCTMKTAGADIEQHEVIFGMDAGELDKIQLLESVP